jgi:hypothetical protein
MLSYSLTHVSPPAGHTWSEYKNTELGFAISYPSDIAHPNALTNPPSQDGIFPGADEVRFYDAQERQMYISLWAQQTNAADPDGWFNEAYGPDGKGWHIAYRNKVGGVDGYPAIGVGENTPSIAPESYDLTIVHGGKAWTLILDQQRLSSLDVSYILQSFRFLHWWERLWK